MVFSEFRLKSKNMPFNSIPFLIFFLLFTIAYYLTPGRETKIGLLIAGSYIFYAYTGIHNLVYLLIITVIAHGLAKGVGKKGNNSTIVLCGVTAIAVILFAAKYTPIFIPKFSTLISSAGGGVFFNLIVPLGISFYSLQAISLVVDVHRGRYSEPMTLKGTSLYLSFFPQAASGPIHRAGELIPQFKRAGAFISENIVVGLKTMLYGYFCKLIIADKIAVVVSPVFNAFDKFDGLSLLIASLLYSLQIYFDFWGYSLIAIGVGRVLGFRININFVAPYRASSFREFWHRWHITLSQWMRDYIYIPLGGKQGNYMRFCMAIIVTFLVSGVWHGVTFNFILWGGVHAGLYLIEDFGRRKLSDYRNHRSTFAKALLRVIRWCVFFLIISFTWLIFRIDNINDLYEIMSNITSFGNWSFAIMIDHYFTGINGVYLLLVLIALVVSHNYFVSKKLASSPVSISAVITDSLFVCVSLIAIILFGDMGSQEFLYFQF